MNGWNTNAAAAWERLGVRFHYLYGDRTPQLMRRLQQLIGRYGVGEPGVSPCPKPLWDETDQVLITYGDMVQEPGTAPLATLRSVLEERMGDAFKTVHLLPFFPYSSDDGFSVIDYHAVDPALGQWSDVEAFNTRYRLMMDLVLNHVSSQSGWFRDYVNDVAPYRDFFIEMDPATDLSMVVRPRTHPLLTATHTRRGTRHVWTTFSADQIDVNFANPDVLFEYLDILCAYIARGARIIRLDAVAYCGKEPGTSCIHLTRTHEWVKVLRDFVEMVAPGVLILTETNVPHAENIGYFGNGDEAHMVYQFSLPPLLAHTLLAGDASALTDWARNLPALKENQTFFNFTASHDGIGVRPLQGLIPDDQIAALVAQTHRMGGKVACKTDADGGESPYELNCTYFDLLGERADRVTERHRARYMASQALMCSLQGMPAVYFNSLFGVRNDVAAVEATGQNRAINRQKWARTTLNEWWGNSRSHHARVFKAYMHLLRTRRQHPAFHPTASQQVMALGAQWFGVERTAPDGTEHVRAVVNVTDFTLQWDASAYPWPGQWTDWLTGETWPDETQTIPFAPYQCRWLGQATPSQ